MATTKTKKTAKKMPKTASKKTASKKATSKKAASKKTTGSRSSGNAKNVSKSTSKKTVTKKTSKTTAVTKAPKSAPKTTVKSTKTSLKVKKTGANLNISKKRASLIETLKNRLLGERDALLRGLHRKETDNEVSSHGDLVDQSTNYSEHEVMLGLAEHDRNRLHDINLALEKIEKGTYGVCEMSGEPISDERLIAMPTARYSVECQAKVEGYG